MRQTYRVVASLIALGVLVQAGALALGWFNVLKDTDEGRVFTGDYNLGHVLHSINGMIVMPVLGLVLLGVSFAAAKVVPGARKWGGIVCGLVILQVLLAFAAYAVPAIGALHGINALAVLGTAVRASMQTRTAVTTGAQSPSAAAGIPAQRTSTAPGTGADLPA